jgi:hypothetical protein
MCILPHNTATSQGSHLDKMTWLEYKVALFNGNAHLQTVHTTTQVLEQFQGECLALCLAISVSMDY